MKKVVPATEPQTMTVTVCDFCGGGSRKDDALRQYYSLSLSEYLPMTIVRDGEPDDLIDLHRDCLRGVTANIRKALGLITE